jgi:hypothetical protein
LRVNGRLLTQTVAWGDHVERYTELVLGLQRIELNLDELARTDAAPMRHQELFYVRDKDFKSLKRTAAG